MEEQTPREKMMLDEQDASYEYLMKELERTPTEQLLGLKWKDKEELGEIRVAPYYRVELGEGECWSGLTACIIRAMIQTAYNRGLAAKE